MSCLLYSYSNQTAVEKAESELGVTFLKLDWIDTTSFCITDDSLSACCRFIHQARKSGASVLVHCAQVELCTYNIVHSLVFPIKSECYPFKKICWDNGLFGINRSGFRVVCLFLAG